MGITDASTGERVGAARTGHALDREDAFDADRSGTFPRHSLVRALGAARRAGRRELPANAMCSACAECDARVLRWVRLGSERVVLCANDAARVRAASERPSCAAEGMLLLLDVVGG